jgi:hypothetical protein
MISFARLDDQIEQAKVDALVILDDSQKEICSSWVAGFTVHTGEPMAGKKYPGRVREVNGNQEWISVPNQREVAQEIPNGLVKNDFDVAFFDEPENQEDGFGHAFRQTLKKVLNKVRSIKRVAIASPGGLWHTPGKQDATIDEDFDRTLLDWLAMGKGHQLSGLPDDVLVTGTGEVRNWIARPRV